MVPAAMPGAQLYYHGGYPPTYPQYVPQPQPVMQPGEEQMVVVIALLFYYITMQFNSLTTVGYLLGVFIKLWIPSTVRIFTSAWS